MHCYIVCSAVTWHNKRLYYIYNTINLSSATVF